MYYDFPIEAGMPETAGPQGSGPISAQIQLAAQPVALSGDCTVETTRGRCRVADLVAGDTLITRDGGNVTLRKVTCVQFTRQDLCQASALAPIRFDPGALPGQCTDSAVLLSPGMPVFSDATTGGTLAAAFPAEAYGNGCTIRRVIPEDGIRYFHLQLANPASICVAGLWIKPTGEPANMQGSPYTGPIPKSDKRVFKPIVG